MALHKIEKGLDLPIPGKPLQVIRGTSPCTRVALVADDYPGMKPRMHVAEGDTVKRGQPLFEDRKMPGVIHTAPGAGKVVAVNRGEKRVLQTVVIELSDGEQSGNPGDDEFISFENYSGAAPDSLSGEQIRALLVESGLWTALRVRPFSKVPSPESQADALFITAMDSNPHAPLPDVALQDRLDDFRLGVALVAKLLDAPTHLCVAEHSELAAALGDASPANVKVQSFAGPHPAGTPGYHIHADRAKLRAADRVPVVRDRLSVYHEQTEPLIHFYSSWAKNHPATAPSMTRVQGVGQVEEVRDEIFSALRGE